MSKTIITLEDMEGDEFRAHIDYGEPFNGESKAHVAGLAMMRHLGTLAERRGPEESIGGAPSVAPESGQ